LLLGQVVGLERKLRDWGEKPKGESGIFRKPWESIDDLIEDIAEVTRDNLEKGKEITEEKKKKILEMIESGEKLLSAQKENLKKLFR
jgi:hypothetical protein